MTKYLQFKPKEYLNITERCWINFQCPNCYQFLSADSENELSICSCGNKYTVSAILFHVVETPSKTQ